eukprot:4678998-Prymnesium_polylepis.1
MTTRPEPLCAPANENRTIATGEEQSRRVLWASRSAPDANDRTETAKIKRDDRAACARRRPHLS